MSSITGHADIMVRASMDIQQVLKRMDDIERHARGKVGGGLLDFGKSVDKAFRLASGGIIGTQVVGRVYDFIADGARKAAEANGRLAASMQMTREEMDNLAMAAGGRFAQFFEEDLPNLLAPLFGGNRGDVTKAINERYGAVLRAQAADRERERELERLRIEEQYVRSLREENALQSRLLNAPARDADIIRLDDKLGHGRRDLARAMGNQPMTVVRSMLEQYDAQAYEAIRLARDERELKEFNDRANDWSEQWLAMQQQRQLDAELMAKADEASARASISRARSGGRTSVAEQAGVLLEAYKSASEIMAMTRLPGPLRSLVADEILKAAEADIRKGLVPGGPGAVGPATIGSAAQAGLGAVFGTGGELAALSRDVRSGFTEVVRALGPIGVKIDELKRQIAQGVPAAFQ